MNPLDLLSGLTPIVSKVLDLIPDPNAKARAEAEMQAELLKYAAEQSAQQAEINANEASNQNVFVSGWRPAIGWTCAMAFMFIYVAAPLATWVAAFFGKGVPMPQFDTNALMSLTTGMLGLGAMRSFEKSRGVAAK
jgi:hypothetical protein